MRKFLFAILSVCAIALTSCAEGDGDLDYGLMKIYIPQAMAGGGINNTRPTLRLTMTTSTYTSEFSAQARQLEMHLL